MCGITGYVGARPALEVAKDSRYHRFFEHPRDMLTYVLERLENLDILQDTITSFYLWLSIVAVYGVQGKQVHDARLVATIHL